MRLFLGRHSWVVLSLVGWSLAAAGCTNPSSKQNSSGSAAVAASEAGPTSDQQLVTKYDSIADEILDTRRKEVEVVQRLLQDTYADAEGALARSREALKGSDPSAVRPAVENLAILVGYLATEGDASVARVRKRLIEGGHHFNPLAPAGSAQGGQHHGDQGTAAHHAAGQAGNQAAGDAAKAPGHAAQPGQTPGHAAQPGKPGHAAPGAGTPGTAAPGGQPGAGHHAAGEKPPAGHAGGAHHHAGPEAHHQSEAGHHEGNAPLIGYDPGYVVVPRTAKKTLLDASRGLAKVAASPTLDALEAEWKNVETVCVSLGIAKK